MTKISATNVLYLVSVMRLEVLPIMCALVTSHVGGLSAPERHELVAVNQRARAWIAEVEPNRAFDVTGTAPFGSLVLWLNGSGTCGDSGENDRVVGTDAGCVVPKGGKATFRNTAAHAVPVLVIDILKQQQPLTVEKETLTAGNILEDASDRNETLLIAISQIRLRAVRNLGDESQWIPSKPRILDLKPKNAVWLRPGTYHLKNMLNRSCSFATVEW